MNPSDLEIEERLPVWRALSDLFLDTELQETDIDQIAIALAASPYSEGKIEEILRFEVTPVCQWNLYSIAGEWAGFDDEWLRRKLAARLDKRPWFRRAVFSMIRDDWDRTKAKLAARRQPLEPNRLY